MYCIFGGEKVKSERKGAQLCLCTGVNYIEVGVVDLVSLNSSSHKNSVNENVLELQFSIINGTTW